MRAVVDTNVLVRAVIKPQGSVGPVLVRLRRRAYTLLLSRAMLDEIVEVLHRPRLRIKYGLDERTLRAVMRLIVVRSEWVQPIDQVIVCRDPKDDMFLEAAIAGEADVIVSGDEDLLTLGSYAGIPIVSPAQFLALLDQTS